MSRSAPIGLAVIGLGRIGILHARNVALNLPGTRLVAVADMSEQRVDVVTAELDVPGYRDPIEMLDAELIDGAVVASPPSTHTNLIELAAARGIHVLCEKPLSLDGPAATRTLGRVDQAGIKLQVGFQMRFDPSLGEAAGRIARGELGALYQMRASLRDALPPPRSYLEASGGYFWDGGIHLFDLARWLMGEVAEVTAFGAALSDDMFTEVGDVDNAMLVLRFESGALGLIETSRVAGYGFESAVEVLGAHATIRVDGSSERLAVLRPGQVIRRHVSDFTGRFGPAYAREVAGFCEAIRWDAPVRVDGGDGLAAMAICEAAVRSWRERRTVALREVPWA